MSTRPAESETWTFDVIGMDCGDCARTIETGVRQLPGVRSAAVSFASATLRVQPDTATLSQSVIVGAVARAGYQATLQGSASGAARPAWRDRRLIELVGAALLWTIGSVAEHSGVASAIVAIPFLAAMLLAGYPVARAARFALSARRADMNVLMLIAAIGAILIGEWEEGASVLVLFTVGLLLQSRTVDRTRRAMQALVRLAPDRATVRRPTGDERVAVGTIKAGELAIVLPGERLPIDGLVETGSSEVDQSAITGESVPVTVSAGNSVFAGTMNGNGLLEVRATKTAAESTLSGIVRMVEQAQSSRAPAQAFIDRFAAVYTPLAVAAAVALALVGSILTGDVRDWVFRGLVMLVVACPCALVISTPVALVSAIGSAARRGILFKGGSAIEALAAVNAVAFDKTGTLTHGRPRVTGLIPLDGITADELLATAAAVERGSAHPIAHGIARAAAERGVAMPAADAFRAQPGSGVFATVEGQEAAVLSPRGLAGLPRAIAGDIARREQHGETVVVVYRAGRLLGAIGLIDGARAEAAGAIAALHAAGLRTIMLTGDNAHVAERIGSALDIGAVTAELLPAGKVAAIQSHAGRGPVAMVGDGINDAPALAAASVGIAMGVGGSDVAIETADVALLADNLDRLPVAIALARSTMRTIRQNIAVSLLVKIVFVALTVAGVTNLWLAVAADMGTSLLVTLNALRLLRASNSAPPATLHMSAAYAS